MPIKATLRIAKAAWVSLSDKEVLACLFLTIAGGANQKAKAMNKHPVCLLDVFFQIACGVEDPGRLTGRPSQFS